MRGALLGVGAFQTIVALALLLSPSTMIDVWPWMLTPLTAQTLGGWFALPGITAIMMGLDGRPSAIRITLQSQVIGLALILVAIARDWSSIDSSNPLASCSSADSPRCSRGCSRSTCTCAAAPAPSRRAVGGSEATLR